ncbi:hypothetical protein [Mycolicibacterium novocastrense]|uniref:hypothetical protein n=1 Tax=Mycolicibacterium novocastrense TaxID=59813 RepID=UPI000A7164D0|nr:hypothetical protein [Mycolicibacterium novocastrense]
MTDDPQERFPDPPTRGASQVVESAIAGATGIVPVAGPSLVEITHLVIGAPYQKRMDTWFEQVARGISDLQARDQAPDWEALVSDEQFLDVLIHASRAIQGTGREAKRLALRNAVMNTASGRSPGEDLERRFVSIVDSCVPEHLRLLLYLDDPARGLRIRGIRKGAVADRMESRFRKEHGATAEPPLPWWTGYMRDALLEELVSAFDEDREASLRLLGDLEDWRFTGSVELGVWSGFVSALGREFLRYIDVTPNTAEAFAAFSDHQW